MEKVRKALSLLWLFQAAVVALLGYIPRLSGLECYCYNEPYDGFPICFWEADRCTGDICYAHKVLQDGVYYETWNCLIESIHHIHHICTEGSFNSATEEYICCSDRDNCNENIQIELPIEHPQPVSTDAVTFAPGSNPLDPSTISTEQPDLLLESTTSKSTPVSSHPTTRLPSTSSILRTLTTQAISMPSATTAPQVAVAGTCHCSESQINCQPNGKCQSPLRDRDDFSCLVSRRYNLIIGEYINHQQCILDVIDYGLYCNGPIIDGLVFHHNAENNDLDICCFIENCNTEDLVMELLANLTTPTSAASTTPITSPATPVTTAFLPALTPPSEIEAHCSHVNWRNSPDVSCGDITGYDVRLFNPDTGVEVTRRVDARGTFHNFLLLERELIEHKSTTVQIRIVSSFGEGAYSSPIGTGCFAPQPPSVYFELKGQRYDNNSVVNILAIGEGSSALLCKTNNQDCCGTLPNRFGEFYYPHGARVSIFITGDGFYRNRGNQMIRLNRRNDVSSPTGRYSCEIPDASGITQKLFINISNEGM